MTTPHLNFQKKDMKSVKNENIGSFSVFSLEMVFIVDEPIKTLIRRFP